MKQRVRPATGAVITLSYALPFHSLADSARLAFHAYILSSVTIAQRHRQGVGFLFVAPDERACRDTQSARRQATMRSTRLGGLYSSGRQQRYCP